MGETRDYLETHGGPGRHWDEESQMFVIDGSTPKEKAKAIRKKHTPQPVHNDPVIDSDKNHEIITEMEKIRHKAGIESYLVAYKGTPCATIVLKYTPQQTTAYATCFINGRKNMFKGFARGCGYDRASAALEGCTIYPPAREFPPYVLTDGANRWHNLLLAAGFEVWQTL